MSALTVWQPKQLDLIRKTVAKDCDRDSKGVNLHLGEFDWFISICQQLRLDPLRRQIYAFVFSKDDASKRQMVPVIGIGGYRSIAERTGNYRPGESEIVYDENAHNPDTNPLGIVYAKTTIFKRTHGEWFPFSESAYWDEFAPVVSAGEGGFEWVDTGKQYAADHPTKAGKPIMRKEPLGEVRLMLDPKKDGWRKMARLMIEKCAEAKALRRGWPDDFAGTYSDGELDRAEVLDLTATEMADAAATERKLSLIGGAHALIIDWCDGSKFARIPDGQFCDTALAWARKDDKTSTELMAWWQRNEMSRAEYKARHGADYLEFHKQFEAMKQAAARRDAAFSGVTDAEIPF